MKVLANSFMQFGSYRMKLNTSNITTNRIAILVNGTNGFRINGQKQLVWLEGKATTNHNLTLYYNNETS
jgi:hypothetical protein